MNDHVQPDIAACLLGHFALPRDVDHLEREYAQRARDRERRLMAHPDIRDPEHPEDDE